ncbi:MAG: OmpW family outer membrane protein [Candidatus Margulisiibacteriota bacterium]
MKSTWIWVVIALMVTSTAQAASVDLSLGLGGMTIDSDPKFQESFGKNTIFQGSLGLLDEKTGFEIRGNLGRYSDISHNPLDIGKDFRFELTPLTVSLLYHVGPATNLIQPYFGAGAGAYFYGFQNNTYGVLETGTKFGFHALGGVKFNFLEHFYLNLEYTKAFVPPIFFSNATNTNTSGLTIGMGFTIPIKEPKPAQATRPKIDATALQIQQLQSEMYEMKEKRAQLEAKVDAFYEQGESLATANIETNSEFAKDFRRTVYYEKKIKELDKKIAEAQTELTFLQQKQQNETGFSEPAPSGSTTVIQETTYITPAAYSPPPPVYWPRPRYHHYNPRDYVAPTTISVSPPSQAERQEYLEKRAEYIRNLKNR